MTSAQITAVAIAKLLQQTNCLPHKVVADIGAGTGKLTKMLLDAKLTVRAVEPNDNMRMYGIQNTAGKSVTWTEGVGESTGLEDNSVQAAFFGSSFNVVDQEKTLEEVARILLPRGWFACCGIIVMSTIQFKMKSKASSSHSFPTTITVYVGRIHHPSFKITRILGLLYTLRNTSKFR